MTINHEIILIFESLLNVTLLSVARSRAASRPEALLDLSSSLKPEAFEEGFRSFGRTAQTQVRGNQ